MKKQQTGIFILAALLSILLFGCEGVAELFHGPKPVEPQPDLMYTVTYNGNGAGGTAPAAQTVNAGTAITVAGEGGLTFPTKTFYLWNDKADGSGTSYPAGDTLTVNSDIVLYAQWETSSPGLYTVTYYANGAGGTVPAAQAAPAGTAIITAGKGSLNYPDKTFTGWNTNANGTGTPYAAGASITGSSNINLFAQWVPNTTMHTVTYYANGASGTVPAAPQTYSAGTVITVAGKGSLTFVYKIFTGWNTKANGTGTPYAAGSLIPLRSNIDLYAQWTTDPTTYTVTYHANGAGGTVPTLQTVNVGTVVTAAGQGSLSYSGKTFTGWNTNEGGGGTSYAAGDTLVVNGNIDLHAQWIVTIYTVTYYANGAGGTVPSAQPANAGTTITVAGKGGLNYPDKTFTGWNTSAGGGGTSYTTGASLTVNSNTSLYAQWIPVLPPPSGITAAAQSSSSIALSWNSVSGAASYNVYRLTTESGTYEKINSSIGTSYTDTGLNPSTTYYYKVSTINAGNDEGDKSSAVSTATKDIEVPGATLAAKLAWLQSNVVSNTRYLIEVNADESIGPNSLSYSGKSGIRLTIIGLAAERTISLSSNGLLFTVGSGVTLVLDNNITLNGRSDNTGSLVRINSGGALVMNEGAKVTGNTASSGGGVYVAGGSFSMTGGVISGNTSSNGGGVFMTGGTFSMTSGVISGNTSASIGGGVYIQQLGNFTMTGGVISGNTSSNGGGGVFMSDGTFSMTSGVISGNTSSSSGGGVYVVGGSFSMTGGTISGNTASSGGGVFKSSTGTGTFKKLPPNEGGLDSGIIYGSEETGVDGDGKPLKNSNSAVNCITTKRSTTAGQRDYIDTSTGRGLSANGSPPFGP